MYFKSAYCCRQFLSTKLTSALLHTKLRKQHTSKQLNTLTPLGKIYFLYLLYHKQLCTQQTVNEVLSMISPPTFSDVIQND